MSASTRVHTRVTFRRRISLVCGVFLVALTLPYPRLPALAKNGKEGVDGSSPSEGFRFFPA